MAFGFCRIYGTADISCLIVITPYVHIVTTNISTFVIVNTILATQVFQLEQQMKQISRAPRLMIRVTLFLNPYRIVPRHGTFQPCLFKITVSHKFRYSMTPDVQDMSSSEDEVFDTSLFQEPSDYYAQEKPATYTNYTLLSGQKLRLRLVGHNPLWVSKPQFSPLGGMSDISHETGSSSMERRTKSFQIYSRTCHKSNHRQNCPRIRCWCRFTKSCSSYPWCQQGSRNGLP